MSWSGPILDNHLHLDSARGRGLDAVRDFDRAGGTHLIVINRPSWGYGVDVRDAEDFRVGYDATVELVERSTEILDGRAWAGLGVHPALVTRLLEDREMAAEEVATIMRSGIDEAARYVESGHAIAIKSGRPHYDVTSQAWDISNEVMRYAFERGADCDCAVQLHTEASEDLSTICEWAAGAGMDPTRVVKHYASGSLRGPIPSVIAREDALLEAIDASQPFLMETDYLDDPDRPGAVLGPKTVPRRAAWLANRGELDALETAHVETPASVYGIDTLGC